MSPMAEKNPYQQGRLRARPVRTPVEKAPVGLRESKIVPKNPARAVENPKTTHLVCWR